MKNIDNKWSPKEVFVNSKLTVAFRVKEQRVLFKMFNELDLSSKPSSRKTNERKLDFKISITNGFNFCEAEEQQYHHHQLINNICLIHTTLV